MSDPKICLIEGCGKPQKNGRGWCNSHYTRWLRHGDPLGGKTGKGEPQKFLSEKAFPYKGDECLIWPFNRNNKGYPQIMRRCKPFYVHRLICAEVNGEPPTPKHDSAHSCGNGHLGCVNPGHLSWKTRKENMEDTLVHGTRNRGERQGSSKLTEEQVRHIRSLRGILSNRQIGKMFGISPHYASEIHIGKTWSWLQ